MGTVKGFDSLCRPVVYSAGRVPCLSIDDKLALQEFHGQQNLRYIHMVYVTIPAPTKFNGKFQRTRAKPIKTQARSERRKGKGKNGTFYFHSKDLDSLLICFQKGTRVALSVGNGSPRGKLICCRCIHLNIRTDTYCVVSPGNVYA